MTASELYTSADGALEENNEAEKVVEDLRALIRGIRAGTQSAGDQKRQYLLLVCSKLADDLNTLLADLKINGQKNHKLESVKKLLKTMSSMRSATPSGNYLRKILRPGIFDFMSKTTWKLTRGLRR